MFEHLPARPALLHPEAQSYAEQALAQTAGVVGASLNARNIPYGADLWQKMDLYAPDALAAEGLPVLMFLHGGAWTGGYKEWMGFMAPLFTVLPAIFISVSYRLSPEARFPDALQDTQDAIAWVWRNIGKLGGDPDQIAVGGHSAGGHLAALAALDTDGLARRGLPADVVKACLPVSATFDLRASPEQRDASLQRAYRYFLASGQDAARASPIDYARKVGTTFLLAWGDKDFPRIKAQGPIMAQALRKAGNAVESLELPDSSHFDTSLLCTRPGHPWTGAAQRLMRDISNRKNVG